MYLRCSRYYAFIAAGSPDQAKLDAIEEADALASDFPGRTALVVLDGAGYKVGLVDANQIADAEAAGTFTYLAVNE
jgi:hypothetical protein